MGFFDRFKTSKNDSDDNSDGYLHLVSTIDGRETKIIIKDLLVRLGINKPI